MPEIKKSPTTTWRQALPGGRAGAIIFSAGIDSIPHAEEKGVVRGPSNIWPPKVVKPFFTYRDLQSRRIPKNREGAVDPILPGAYRSARTGLSKAGCLRGKGGRWNFRMAPTIKGR
jgi:hypothetical protein